MVLEKAFAIQGGPEPIWQALQQDLASGDLSQFAVTRAVPNELLELDIRLQGGVRASLMYRLIPREGHTEVVATMFPSGLRYAIFRIITLGREDISYELMLAQGLRNLKEAVEGRASE